MIEFYHDLMILMGSHTPSCAAWVDKCFDYYVLNYAHSGTLHWSIGAESHTLIAPVSWLTFPGPRFRFGVRNGEKSWDHRFVAFQGKRVQRYIKSAWLPTQNTPAIFPVATPEQFRLRFDHLLAYIQNGTQHTDHAGYALEGLLLEFMENTTRSGTRTRWSPDILALSERIRQMPQQTWDFAEECRRLSMSLTHFRRIFKQLVGEAPQQFRLRCQMNFAARLLAQEMPVKEVARQCGMDDVYYFSRMFKKFMHIPPARFQREARW